jgi:hypothetical protein
LRGVVDVGACAVTRGRVELCTTDSDYVQPKSVTLMEAKEEERIIANCDHGFLAYYNR